MEENGALQELGAGAMGVTYRAQDSVLRRVVALKVIGRSFARHPATRARFLREARAAAQLRHPNVASVFHYGEQDGQCFYAMELVEGETLEEGQPGRPAPGSAGVGSDRAGRPRSCRRRGARRRPRRSQTWQHHAGCG